jgi:hypothetical protein
VHTFFEGFALLFFAALVFFETLSHLSEDNKKRARRLDVIGLICFAMAVLAEIVAYPYGQRNDTLSGELVGSLGKVAQRASDASAAAIMQAGQAETASGNAVAKSAQANDAAFKALREANSFEQAIASAKQQASEAKALVVPATAQLIQARIDLARVSPRSLSTDQLLNALAVMRGFSGHPQVTVSSYGMDGEGTSFAAQLISLLSAAQIPVEDDRAMSIVSGGFENGVHIRGPASENAFMSALKDALSPALENQVFINGPSVRVSALSGGSTMSGGAVLGGGGGVIPENIPAVGPVSIMVGIKPYLVLTIK